MKYSKNLINQKFGLLKVIKQFIKLINYKNTTYCECLCQCGKITVVTRNALVTKHTKSCGCLKLLQSNLKKFAQPKTLLIEAAARSSWRRRYSEITIQKYIELSQKNCYYCNAKPSLISKINRKTDGEFSFLRNTLDRIDSSKGHVIGNIIPCCFTCNTAKLDRSLDEFKIYIQNIINKNRISMEEHKENSKNIDISILNKTKKNYIRTAIKATYLKYNDGNLKLEQFYQLVSCNCYYCGQIPLNKKNMSSTKSSKMAKENGNFFYNGLDRIDNNLPHDYENVITCCKYCNSAKSNKTLQEFYDWIERLKLYQTNSLNSFSKSSA